MKNNPTNITSEGASKKLVPELRFPEFVNEGEWEEHKISEIAPLQRGFDLPIHSLQKGSFPVVYSNGIMNYHNEYKCEAPGLITGRSGTIGKFTFISSGYYWPHNTSLWVTNFNGYNPLYIYYLYQSINIEQFASGSGVPTLNRNHVHEHTCIVPLLQAEQQKIAQCLSSLDELIAATKEKVELLKEHKRGLMQKLFPVKGKTLPELRFPEFKNEGEWKYVPMCRISRKITDKYKSDKTLPVLTNSASSGVVKQQDYFDREIVTKSNLDNYQILDVDDFVYNPRISSIAPVGPISRNNLTKGIMSPLYTVFRFHDGDKEFLSHFFNSNSWHDYIKKKANFGARYDRINISTDEFFGLPIPLPSIAEQKKIASVLSFLDDMIEQYIEKVNVLELHKKGLMQKLFPQK